jgi:hypothetical protein
VICIAPRARRLLVGSLSFVLLLYTFDVQAASFHIAKSWSFSPSKMSILILHPISTILPASKRSTASPCCIEAWIETDQLPKHQLHVSISALAPRRSRQPPRQNPGRHGPIDILRAPLYADRCPSISRRERACFCVTVCNFELPGIWVSPDEQPGSREEDRIVFGHSMLPVASIIDISISTIHCPSR